MRLVCQCFRLYVVDSVYNTLLSEMLTDFFDAELRHYVNYDRDFLNKKILKDNMLQYRKSFRYHCSVRRSMLM